MAAMRRWLRAGLPATALLCLGSGPCSNESAECGTDSYTVQPGMTFALSDPCSSDPSDRISNPNGLQLFLPWFIERLPSTGERVELFVELDSPLSSAGFRIPYTRAGVGSGELLFVIQDNGRRNFELTPGPGVQARLVTGARELRCSAGQLDQCALSVVEGTEVMVDAANGNASCTWSGDCATSVVSACTATFEVNDPMACGLELETGGAAIVVLSDEDRAKVQVEEMIGGSWVMRQDCMSAGTCTFDAPGTARLSGRNGLSEAPSAWTGNPSAACSYAHGTLELSLMPDEVYSCRPVFATDLATLTLDVITRLNEVEVFVARPADAPWSCDRQNVCQTTVQVGTEVEIEVHPGSYQSVDIAWNCEGRTETGVPTLVVDLQGDVRCSVEVSADTSCSGPPVPNFEVLTLSGDAPSVDDQGRPVLNWDTQYVLDARSTDERSSQVATYRWEIAPDGEQTAFDSGAQATWTALLIPGSEVAFTLTVDNQCMPDGVATLTKTAVGGF